MNPISAREFEKRTEELVRSFRIIILQGDNVQAKSDLFRLLRKALLIEPDDPFRLVHLDSESIEADPARLADELGVSRQTIISIEKGRFDPSLPLAFRIAHAFGCTIEDIFEPE